MKRLVIHFCGTTLSLCATLFRYGDPSLDRTIGQRRCSRNVDWLRDIINNLRPSGGNWVSGIAPFHQAMQQTVLNLVCGAAGEGSGSNLMSTSEATRSHEHITWEAVVSKAFVHFHLSELESRPE